MAREKVGRPIPSQETTKIEAVKHSLPWRRETGQLSDRYYYITGLFDSQRGLVTPFWDRDAGIDVEAVGCRREGRIDPLVVSKPVTHQAGSNEMPLKLQEPDHFFRGHGFSKATAYYLHPNGILTKEVIIRPGTPLRETADADVSRKEKKDLLQRLSGAGIYKLKT